MPNRRLRATEPPLYDSAFEHDACGVGFVADASRANADRVLPLALAGLGALGHRGAFAADGESSDGAGILFDITPAYLARVGAPGGPRRRVGDVGVLMLFCGVATPEPNAASTVAVDVAAREASREIVHAALVEEGLVLGGWRDVPVDVTALGPEAAATVPPIAQAFVQRPPGVSRVEFERRLVLARRRIEALARDAGLHELAVVSASADTVVYKALVRGDRLAAFYADLAPGLPARFALFHQRYATNTRPVWRLAQPFGRIAHNGEINTVRANREEVRGRRADVGRSAFARRVAAIGPLVSTDGSDSLSLDDAVELLTAAGWRLDAALLALIPDAASLRRPDAPSTGVAPLAPWDGPAALAFADGRSVGALLDRNGLRPAAFAVTKSGLVTLASEAAAVPIEASETVRRGRLGPGDLLVVDLASGAVLEDEDAKASVAEAAGIVATHGRRVSGLPIVPTIVDRRGGASGHDVGEGQPTSPALRYLAGLDAERFRLDIRTLVLEGHEPLWSMGDDTPTAGTARVDRRVADHLRQSFAQVTNPPIDPERERVVMDLSVELGRRPRLLDRPYAATQPVATRHRRRVAHPGQDLVRLERPIVVNLPAVLGWFEEAGQRVVRLDATWSAADGPQGLGRALDRLARRALGAARHGAHIVAISDRRLSLDRLPVPSVLAAGAAHTALTAAGLRGRTDIVVEAADVLDPHALAMALASGARAVSPWLAIELATEVAGSRGAEDLAADAAVGNLADGLAAGLRKTLARMGISTIASYIAGQFFEVLELSPDVLERCFAAAPAWPGRLELTDLAARQLRRRAAAAELAAPLEPHRFPDPGFVRFRAGGEAHLYAPAIVREIQALAGGRTANAAEADAPLDGADSLEGALARYRDAIGRTPLVVRDQLEIVGSAAHAPVPLDQVEPVSSIVRRFVASAMSLGALSPEAHQAITIGMQMLGAAANTGEGGEDPAWYEPGIDGARRDAKIKQVASGRFGVTAEYLARAEQLEIKIAQGSKPGEGGQLPGRKATAYIAALRRGRAGQSYISPPPHHDIYSIEDLAQLVADLRAVAPRARIGVKLVSTRGIGTIAAGVAKAGADYVHVGGHSGGTGASPLSSIKHVGVPWEFGLAEVHQTLLRNNLRDRIAIRVDGGLHAGRDLLVAALLGAEEFGFGTAALVAIGCDMARQCHLDTCPTGIATQREDLRAKFGGTPEDVVRYFTAIAEDLRRELAAIGARSVGEIVGRGSEFLRPAESATVRLEALLSPVPWAASADRRGDAAAAARVVRREPASRLEESIVEAASRPPRPVSAGQDAGLRLTTADRSFGARLSGAVERHEVAGPVRLDLRGAAGQSLGAFLGPSVELRFTGVANDYVGKGLSGGTLVVRPEPDLAADASRQAIAGNTCLYGATSGRLHLIGRAGMRFGVRNSGADAVVEGIGPHGCEYMTAGTVVVLGPVGSNFGAGMTGGRAYLWHPGGSVPRGLAPGLRVVRLASLVGDRPDGAERVAELRRLIEVHAMAGSALAARILQDRPFATGFWLVEPVELPSALEPAPAGARGGTGVAERRAATRSGASATRARAEAAPQGGSQPDRNPLATGAGAEPGRPGE